MPMRGTTFTPLLKSEKRTSPVKCLFMGQSFHVMILEYANTLFFRWWSYVWSMESVYVNQGY